MFNLPKVNLKSAIAIITVLGVIGLPYILVFKDIPDRSRDGFFMLVGIIVRSSWDPIYRFFFPSKREGESIPPPETTSK